VNLLPKLQKLLRDTTYWLINK